MSDNKHLVLIFDTVPPRVSSSFKDQNLRQSTGHAAMMDIYNVISQLLNNGLNKNSIINTINAKTLENLPLNANSKMIISICEEKLRSIELQPSQVSIESLDQYGRISIYYRTEFNNNNKDNFDSDFLIPFLTVRKSLREKFGSIYLRRINLLLGVTTDAENANSGYYAVSRYLFIESLVNQSMWDAKSPSNSIKVGNIEHSQCYFVSYGQEKSQIITKRFARTGIDRIKSYLPIFPLNTISYKVFSSYVCEYFDKGFTIIDRKHKYDLLAEISKKLLDNQASFNETDKEQQPKYMEILMVETIKLTCSSMLEEVEGVDLESLYKYCINIPILSLLFLLSLLSFSKVDMSEKALISLIRSSQEYADGVLQLIENAVEHAKEIAYLRFRIKGSDDKSLAEWYGYDYRPGDNYFLEILLVDMSGSSIPITFNENLKNRGGKNPFTDHDLTIKDFFEPDETKKNLWNKYYSDVSNLTFHYGLRRFLSVIEDQEGFFRVVTTSKIIPKEKDLFVSKKEARLTSGIHLPGTEYNIILPIRTKEPVAEPIAVGFGIELDFTTEFINRETRYFPIAESLSIDVESVLNQKRKEQKIEEVRNQISKFVDSCINPRDKRLITENKIILCFDMEQMGINIDKQIIVDIFCKALIQYLHIKGRILKHRIAIINANHTFIYGFSGLFAVYCNNTEEITTIRKQLEDTQIYLCDNNLNNELLFIGGNLAATYQYSDALASRKAAYPKSLQVLQLSLSRKNGTSRVSGKKKNKKLKIAPFELCVNTSNSSCQTLFEKRVEKELQNDLQKIPLGCRLSNAHMRVGSKIHITDYFYDATLLLASSYYTERFSYLLAKKIYAIWEKLTQDQTQDQKLSSITLVGYEDYSEALIFETRKRLENLFHIKKVTYTLYSEQYKDSFKFPENIQNNTLFCIIVPVNSTLTTHTKVWAALSTKLKALGETSHFKVDNFALIVVSNKGTEKEKKLQEKYWKSIDVENRIITTKFFEKWVGVEEEHLGNPEVNYNILLSSIWADPLTCDACFPNTSNYVDERPMLEVSKSSVMTYILSGLQESIEKKDSNLIANAPGSINYLKNNLLYGHISYQGNHFQFYLQTDKLMQSILDSPIAGTKPSSAEVFSGWMESTRIAIEEQRKTLEMSGEKSGNRSEVNTTEKPCIVYDIVVSPIQSMNGQFVHEIVSNVFKNLQMVLYIDVLREFRENIESKYSNLMALYWNNINAGRRAVIRFHYVDSTISSGVTIRRAQSLLHSLFPEVAYSCDADVKVSLFDTVTLLVNRCSPNTMDDYVKRGNFYRFIDVKISSIRSNRDNSCVLCNQKRNYELIMGCCSTNEMYAWWSDKLKKISPEPYENMIASKDQGNERDERSFLRLLSSHTITDSLTKLNAGKINDADTVREIIIQLFNEIFTNKEIDDREKLESLISYIKVMSRPFLSYRKSTLEAVFRLLLELMEMITSLVLNSKKPKNQKTDLDFLYEHLNEIAKLQEEKTGQLSISFDTGSGEKKETVVKSFADLFKVLVVQLSELGAKYLMRKDNIAKILKTACHLSKYLDYSEFERLVLASIKRILVLNRDESIGLWLEWLLCLGKEYEEYEDRDSQENTIEELYKDGLQNMALIKIVGKSDLLSFYQLLFLENTYVIHDAIVELYKKTKPEDGESKIVKNHINEYYFDNYRKFMRFDYSFQNSIQSDNPFSLFLLREEAHGEEAHANTEMIDETTKLLKLYRKLKEENNFNIEKYYEELCDLIKEVTNAKNVAILGYGWSKEPYKIATTANTMLGKYFDLLIEKPETETAKIIDDRIVIMFKNSENEYSSNKTYIIIEDRENVKNNEDSGENDTQETKKAWTLERLFLVRKVLTFRSEFILKINKDFSNDLIESYQLTRKFFNLRLRKKAATHSPESLQEEACYIIEEKIKEDVSLEEDQELKQLVLLARMASDSLISELYVKHLSEEYDKKMKSRMKIEESKDTNKNNKTRLKRIGLEETTLTFNSKWIKYFESISRISESDGLDETTNLKLKIESRDILEFHNIFPERNAYYPFLFVFALFQNAIKYGLKDSKTGKVHVSLSIDADYLTISNKTSIYSHPERKPESTTIQAIRYYYRTLGYDICVSLSDTENTSVKMFTIKLPIVNI